MGIQLLYSPSCQILSLGQGSDTARDRDQHAGVLGWHHEQQQPWPQELSGTRQLSVSAFLPPLRDEEDSEFP